MRFQWGMSIDRVVRFSVSFTVPQRTARTIKTATSKIVPPAANARSALLRTTLRADEALKQGQQFRRMMLECMPRFAEVRENGFNGVPEARTVIHLSKMRELVSNNVIDDMHREMNQPPVEADLAVAGTAAPTRGGGRQRIGPELNA